MSPVIINRPANANHLGQASGQSHSPRTAAWRASQPLLAIIVAAVMLAPILVAQEPDEPEPDGSAPAITSSATVIMAEASEGGQMEVHAFQMSSPAGNSPLAGAQMFFSSPMMMGAAGIQPMMMGSGGIQSNSVGWLQDDNILNELEVVAEQREKLQQLRDEVQKRRQDFGATIRDLPADKRITYIRDFSSLLTTNIDDQVEGILLPHQLKRIRQIQLQTQMRGAGIRSLENAKLVELLEISDEQREQLKKKQSEVQKELKKKLELVRKEALDEVLSVLTPAQRKKLAELTGSEYEFKARPMFPSSISAKAKGDEKKE